VVTRSVYQRQLFPRRQRLPVMPRGGTCSAMPVHHRGTAAAGPFEAARCATANSSKSRKRPPRCRA
jgi:hypothetical protein